MEHATQDTHVHHHHEEHSEKTQERHHRRKKKKRNLKLREIQRDAFFVVMHTLTTHFGMEMGECTNLSGCAVRFAKAVAHANLATAVKEYLKEHDTQEGHQHMIDKVSCGMLPKPLKHNVGQAMHYISRKVNIAEKHKDDPPHEHTYPRHAKKEHRHELPVVNPDDMPKSRYAPTVLQRDMSTSYTAATRRRF